MSERKIMEIILFIYVGFLFSKCAMANEINWHHIETKKISQKKCYYSTHQDYFICRVRFNFVKLTDVCTFAQNREANSFKIDCKIFENFEKRYFQILREKPNVK